MLPPNEYYNMVLQYNMYFSEYETQKNQGH